MPKYKTLKQSLAARIALSFSLLFILLLTLANWWWLKHSNSTLPRSSDAIFTITSLVLFALFTVIFFTQTNQRRSQNKSLISLIDSEHEILTLLHKNAAPIESYSIFLEHLDSVSGAISSAIYVPNEITSEMTLLVNTKPDETPWPTDSPHDTTILSDGEIQLLDDHSSSSAVVFMPILTGAKNQAQLILRMPSEMVLTPQMKATFALYSKFMANILDISKLSEINLRNVQYEERSTIARELHDSIAQSLSYMKIQASRIQDMISSSTTLDTNTELMIDNVVQDFRTTLNIAYRHLRELMSSYRITLGGRGFTQALLDSIKELSDRSVIAINVDNRLPENTLTVAEEIQLLQIIRESLSNLVRHSQATYAQVSLQCNDEINVRIEDNGIGLPKSYNRERHHGIVIMQERVLALDGTIQFKERTGGGTVISVRFQTSNQIHEKNMEN